MVAPKASIAGIAAVRAVPNTANTATKPPITTPNVPIATAPSVPVLARGVMDNAIADTAPANTAMPTALS